MRLYVPATVPLLRAAVDTGRIDVAAGVVAESDGEEDEYAAMFAAAEASGPLLSGQGRRVVLVVETEASDACDLADLVAIHADTETIDPDDDDLPELGWFAPQELSDLLG